MAASQIITIVFGLGLIAFILWWFFAPHKETAVHAEVKDGQQSETVVVKGGYSPATIIVKKGLPATINFDLQDSTACLSMITFDKLGINEKLNAAKDTTVKIPTNQAGEYNFACGMDMFHGKVIVK